MRCTIITNFKFDISMITVKVKSMNEKIAKLSGISSYFYQPVALFIVL
jgi:hypothetical protein